MPPGNRVRPTSDRVKESVFAALGPGRIVGARVLDLYAGSGALALEALSRGAASAILVESDAAAAAAIRANIETLGFAGRAALRAAPVAGVLGGPPPELFDLALLDPPYDTPGEEVGATVARLVTAGWLAASATVVVERPAGSSPLPLPEGWESTWERCYGDTLVLFAQRK